MPRGGKVTRVELKVGHLRQVVPDSLDVRVRAGGRRARELEGAELVIEEVPAAVRCARAAQRRTLAAFPAHCGACGRWTWR